MSEGGWKRALRRELAGEPFFDEGVEAARNACVAGASIASAAITAAAYYDNPLTGIGALRACMERLAHAPFELVGFREALAGAPHPGAPESGFAPGFGFVAGARAEAVAAAGLRLVKHRSDGSGRLLRFFLGSRPMIEASLGPLNPAGLAALVFVDHGVEIERAERWFLSWRIDAAVAEAQKARRGGLGNFPFLSERYVYEGSRPPPGSFNVDELRGRLGLD